MRVAIFDMWGTLSWWLRLAGEGCDVRVFIDPRDVPVENVGDGLVQKEASFESLVAWAKQEPENTIVLFCQNKFGSKADELRKDGLYVIGGGAFSKKLEQDRIFGQQVAEHVGIAIPKFRAFSSISDAIDYCKSRRQGGVFKSDTFLEADATQLCRTGDQLAEYLYHLRDRFRDKVDCIIQELVGGPESVDFDVNRWWDGKEFVGPYGLTIEKKRFMDGEFGPSTGCALNAIWHEEDPPYAQELHFDKLAEVFASADAMPGIYAINTRIDDNDGTPYFLEWTSRLGYDSEPTAALLVESLSAMLWRVATGQGSTSVSSELAYSVRMSVPPYPFEDVKEGPKSCIGIPIPYEGDLYSVPFIGYDLRKGDQGYEVAAAEGLVGLAAAVGDDLDAMGEQVLDFARDLHEDVSKLQLRTDGVEAVQGEARKLEALGVDVHPAILVGAKERVSHAG